MSERIKLILVSDIHYSPNIDYSKCIWKYTPQEELPGLIDEFVKITNEEIKPDLVIDLGDRIVDVDTETDERNEQWVKKMLDDRLDMPITHVEGNHDIRILSKEDNRRILGYPDLPYTINVKGYKLIFFDSMDPMLIGIGGRVGEKQIAWLEHEVRSDMSGKMIFSHHPLHEHDIDRNSLIPRETLDKMYIENMNEVVNTIERGKNVLFHACAHMHWFSFLSNSRCTYLVNPPLSAAFPAKKNAPGWFMEVEVDQNIGLITAKVHTIHPRRVVGTYHNYYK